MLDPLPTWYHTYDPLTRAAAAAAAIPSPLPPPAAAAVTRTEVAAGFSRKTVRFYFETEMRFLY